MAIDKANLATVEKMWRREVEAAHTYKLLAGRETDQKRRDILLRLAAQEDKHAARCRAHPPPPEKLDRGNRARLTWFQASPIPQSSSTAWNRKKRRPTPSTAS
jgi:hypothetical protein